MPKALGAIPVIPLVLALALAQAGCGGSYRLLRSEDHVPQLAGLKRLANQTPQRTVRVPVEMKGRPTHVALHESGPGDAPRVLVLIHGVLSDARAWRFVRGELARDHRLIIVDLPGSGQSDALDPALLGAGGYSPPLLCRAVLDALEARLAQSPPVERITLMGHSLGGMLVVRMLSDEQVRRGHENLLARVDGAVLFTPIDVALEKELPAFRQTPDATDLTIAVAAVSGVLREKVARSTLEGVADRRLATREEADRLIRLLINPRTRRAHQSMLLNAVPWQGRRPDWSRIEQIVAHYPRVEPRCLIVWGARDELFPLSMGHKWANELPRAQLHIVPAAMHSLPTERPETCAAIVRRFVRESDAPPPQRPSLVEATVFLGAALRTAAHVLESYVPADLDSPDRIHVAPRKPGIGPEPQDHASRRSFSQRRLGAKPWGNSH